VLLRLWDLTASKTARTFYENPFPLFPPNL
jgi:hypothetical protein